jgi:hypothetical protein
MRKLGMSVLIIGTKDVQYEKEQGIDPNKIGES